MTESAGTTFDRPAFIRMIKAIEDKKVNMVITKDLSRFGRNYSQIGFYIDEYFPEHKVRYIAINDNIDTEIDSIYNDIVPYISIGNDKYAKDTSRKVKSVKHQKQKDGQFIGSKAPYGYKKDPENKNHLIIDCEVKPIIKRIFKEACQREILPSYCNGFITRQSTHAVAICR